MTIDEQIGERLYVQMRRQNDLRAVQESLGHSSPTVTAIYAHTKAEQVQAAAGAAATLHLLA